MIFDLSKQLLDDINQAMKKAADQGLSQSQTKHIIEAALRRCDLVTREEFDAQQAVLARTREKLEQLESKIAAMENH